jgi:hypothetical protein
MIDSQYRPGSSGDPRKWVYTDGFHLVVDGDHGIDLLHQFAARIGFKPEWFQGDHYVCTTPLAAERAVAAGATLIGMSSTARVMRPRHARPEGFEPEVLGVGAPAFRLARERHGDVLEFIQGPGNRTWMGKRNNNPAPADRRGTDGVAREKRIIRS